MRHGRIVLLDHPDFLAEVAAYRSLQALGAGGKMARCLEFMHVVEQHRFGYGRGQRWHKPLRDLLDAYAEVHHSRTYYRGHDPLTRPARDRYDWGNDLVPHVAKLNRRLYRRGAYRFGLCHNYRKAAYLQVVTREFYNTHTGQYRSGEEITVYATKSVNWLAGQDLISCTTEDGTPVPVVGLLHRETSRRYRVLGLDATYDDSWTATLRPGLLDPRTKVLTWLPDL